jgi:hypothetical protein
VRAQLELVPEQGSNPPHLHAALNQSLSQLLTLTVGGLPVGVAQGGCKP